MTTPDPPYGQDPTPLPPTAPPPTAPPPAAPPAVAPTPAPQPGLAPPSGQPFASYQSSVGGHQGQPGWSAPPAPKKTKWKKILLIVGLVLGLCFAGIGACSYWVYGLVTGPMDAANAYMKPILEGDYDHARTLSDPACAAELEEFLSISEADQLLGYDLLIHEMNSDASGTSGSVQGHLLFADESNVPTRVELNQNGEVWQVCRVRLNVGPEDD